MAKVKVQITLEDSLLRDVDDYCDKNYMNRSWLISQSLVQTINQQKIIDSMVDISIALKNASEKGDLDEDTKRQMDEFNSLCKLFVSKRD